MTEEHQLRSGDILILTSDSSLSLHVGPYMLSKLVWFTGIEAAFTVLQTCRREQSRRAQYEVTWYSILCPSGQIAYLQLSDVDTGVIMTNSEPTIKFVRLSDC